MSDRPEITCYTLISRDVELLTWCVQNARERAGLAHEWLVVHWINHDQPEEEVEAVIRCCQRLRVRRKDFLASSPKDHPNRTAWFLHNLYRGWNIGYEYADAPWVARLGSDQFFSWGWLALLRKASMIRSLPFGQSMGAFHCWTIESPVAKRSRHEVLDLGSTYQEFKVAAFDERVAALARAYPLLQGPGQYKLHYRHPYRGLQNRPDGCTWLQPRQLWEDYGLLPDTINDEGVTGDVSYFDRINDAGVASWLVPHSVTYHLVRGESREVQL